MNNDMAIDPFTALKRPRSSNEDENSDKVKPQSKKKENSATDVPVVVSDWNYTTGPEEDAYIITVDTWKNLPTLRKSRFRWRFWILWGNGLQKNGHDDISNRTQGLWNWEGKTIHGHDRTDQRKNGSLTRKTVAVMADKNTKNENGGDLE
jgi:hypothetical protein